MVQLTPEIADICQHCHQPIFTDDAKRPALTVGPITLNPMFRACSVSGVSVHLTAREFDILYLLAQREGRVCSKDTIFTVVVGLDSDVEIKIIDVFICKLRRKLGDAASMISTVWGRGYCLGVNRTQEAGVADNVLAS